MKMVLRLVFSITFLVCFVTARMIIHSTPNYFIQYQPLEINCTSSTKVPNNNFNINAGVRLVTSVFYNESTRKCMQIIDFTKVECADVCKCTSDGQSVSYSYNVTTENSSLMFTCISRGPDLTSSIYIEKAREPGNVTFNTSSPVNVREEHQIGPISCKADDCVPACMYSWTGPSGFTWNGRIFQIDDIPRNASGIYTCTGANSIGQSTGSVDIIVQYGPTEIILNPENDAYIVNEGEALIPVTCSAECNPECTIAWAGPGISSPHILSITNISRINTGQFICTANNTVGTNQKALNITVRYKPFTNVTIISDPKTYVIEGSTMNLTCTVYGGYPLANISFGCNNRKDMVYTEEESFSITTFLTFKAERNDSNRICTCFAHHILWSQPENKSTTIIVYYSPSPTVIFEEISNSTVLYEFDTVSIKCKVSGGNPLAKLDLTCGKNKTGNTGNNSLSSYSSISMNVTRDLNSEFCFCIGRHQLFAHDVTGVILLQVYYPPHKPHLSVTPTIPFLDGQFVEVTCNVTGGNPLIHKYEWYIDTNLQQIPTNTRRYVYGNVSEGDNNKQVYCRVYNIYTEKKNISTTSETLVFNVEYGPRMLGVQTEHVIVEGQSASIKCEAVGNPHPYVSWEHNDQNVSITTKSESVLNITDADRSIQGIYICKAYSMSSHGLLNSYLPIQLTVNYPPDVSIVAFEYDIKEGGSVTLMCNASGQPANYDYLGWEHSYSGISIRKTIQSNGSHLSLMQLSYQDMGKYTCKVKNGIRNRNQSLIQKASHELKVEGAPIRIPAVSAIPVFTTEQFNLLQATISFYSFPNVTYLTWYNLTSKTSLITSANIVTAFNEMEIPYTLYTVLVNLTDFCYTASLNIQNFQSIHSGYYALEVSNGEESVNFTIRAVLSGPPKHPSNVTVEVFGTSVLVHVLPGFNGGHDQKIHINYTLCTKDNMFEKTVQDSGTGFQSLNIDNLQPATQYCLFVFSSNRRGFSSYNDTHCCEEFVILTKQRATTHLHKSVFAIAGGTVGCILAISLIIAAIYFLRMKRNTKGGDKQKLEHQHGGKYEEDADGLKDNPLYGSAINFALDHEEQSYSGVSKMQKSKQAKNTDDRKKGNIAAKRQLEESGEDIQLDTVYENSIKFLDLGSATAYGKQNSSSRLTGSELNICNKNKDGLIYADLEFAPQYSGTQFVIRGLENKTIYAFIDPTKTAEPLLSDDDESI